MRNAVSGGRSSHAGLASTDRQTKSFGIGLWTSQWNYPGSRRKTTPNSIHHTRVYYVSPGTNTRVTLSDRCSNSRPPGGVAFRGGIIRADVLLFYGLPLMMRNGAPPSEMRKRESRGASAAESLLARHARRAGADRPIYSAGATGGRRGFRSPRLVRAYRFDVPMPRFLMALRLDRESLVRTRAQHSFFTMRKNERTVIRRCISFSRVFPRGLTSALFLCVSPALCFRERGAPVKTRRRERDNRIIER